MFRVSCSPPVLSIVVCPNPYSTTRTSDKPLVISGILLKFYSGGSLEQIFKEDRVKAYDWQCWPIQIGTALSHIHGARRTHIDIKPANVVLDAQGNALLLDISGIGGITYSWLAPEIRHEEPSFDLPFEARVLHSTWAYGKLLLEIAAFGGNFTFTETLLCVAGHLMEENTCSRMSLSEAVSQLNDYAGREERFSMSH